jgi:hypothetical protein
MVVKNKSLGEFLHFPPRHPLSSNPLPVFCGDRSWGATRTPPRPYLTAPPACCALALHHGPSNPVPGPGPRLIIPARIVGEVFAVREGGATGLAPGEGADRPTNRLTILEVVDHLEEGRPGPPYPHHRCQAQVTPPLLALLHSQPDHFITTISSLPPPAPCGHAWP